MQEMASTTDLRSVTVKLQAHQQSLFRHLNQVE
jgi:hypothetical protein